MLQKFLLCVLLAWLLPAGATSPQAVRVDLVRVDKAARTLSLIGNGVVLHRFSIRLGGAPIGHKQREGDRRTPEGRYLLDFRKADSAFYRAIHVSYPNRQDRANARRLGVPPGGAIMIHGQPNGLRLEADSTTTIPYDWTDGCIALSNADMTTLWNLVRVPTPIEIVP
ncbi:L,D-transpeptidase family protein [Thermomonas sp.]|uniref:L,D-transpeptidase family protein n=1 Tax=Thermomonas sp. TaxID=1971895 RepID=UPI001DEE3C2E|nr:L,D-transpeptidase family protein [Thermomonas sp.]MBZ0087585.1 L,D-transpeptidase family protein [Thermomonas sp.]HRO62795.1 L,D-transpeptidase family protein [Thermomonas sp.]